MVSQAKLDPTRTLTLRNKFVAQFRARYTAIKKASNESIVKNDCFGLSSISIAAQIQDSNLKDTINPIPSNEFRGLPTSVKTSKYMEWFEQANEDAIFDEIDFPTYAYYADEKGDKNFWYVPFITSSYLSGIAFARAAVKRDTKVRQTLGLTKEGIGSVRPSQVFTSKDHQDRAKVVIERVFTDLKGISATMSTQINRSLSEGLLRGDGPAKIAKDIANRVDAIGIHRATILARTEVVRAHHLAAIQTYRDMGVGQVTIAAEWVTAQDTRVCELCAPHEGKIYTLDRVEFMIPVHPQCRCETLPVNVVSESEIIQD